jgi:hypothetical protein
MKNQIWVVYHKNPNLFAVEGQDPHMFSTFELAQKYQSQYKGFIVTETASDDLIEDLKKQETN